jgi:hypothetical protein
MQIVAIWKSNDIIPEVEQWVLHVILPSAVEVSA